MAFKLRAVELEDADLFYEWENDMATWEVGNTLRPFSRFALEQYVMQSQNESFYAAGQMRLMVDVEDEQGIRTIGCADLFDFEPRDLRAGMGLLIRKEERGKGYAKGILELLWNYVMKAYSLRQLYCFVPCDNQASKRMLLSGGFEHTATLKDWIYIDGKPKDVEVYQRIKNN